jgi:hypothetical protein
MTEFNLNKYQTLKNLYDEETMIGEHEETYELLNPTNRSLRYSVKRWRDNLENIIKND